RMHMSYRVLLVDDHRLMREAAMALIEPSVEFRVVAEADGCEHALALLQRTVPDLIVVSMPVPRLEALDAPKQLGRQFKRRADCDDFDAGRTAMQCGARGLVLRRHSARELLKVLQTVAQGGSCFDEATNHRHRHRGDVRPSGRASVANTL